MSFRIGDFKQRIDPALLKRDGGRAATAVPRTSSGR